MKTEITTVDAYIEAAPAHTQALLHQLRAYIQAQVPEATEKISYGMPTFVLNGNLVHYAAYARHIGFYPGAVLHSTFAAELAGYKTGKGSVQFPLDQPLPLDLVGKVVQHRVVEQRAKRAR